MVKTIKAIFLCISDESSTFAGDFKICEAMKRFIYFLILAASIVSTGCSKDEPTPKSAIEVVGNTYRLDDGSDYVSIYFARNYTCVYTSDVNGTFTSASQLTYRINEYNVDVYFDNSSTWIESKRGTLFLHLSYYPSTDIIMMNGMKLKRVN